MSDKKITVVAMGKFEKQIDRELESLIASLVEKHLDIKKANKIVNETNQNDYEGGK